MANAEVFTFVPTTTESTSSLVSATARAAMERFRQDETCMSGLISASGVVAGYLTLLEHSAPLDKFDRQMLLSTTLERARKDLQIALALYHEWRELKSAEDRSGQLPLFDRAQRITKDLRTTAQSLIVFKDESDVAEEKLRQALSEQLQRPVVSGQTGDAHYNSPDQPLDLGDLSGSLPSRPESYTSWTSQRHSPGSPGYNNDPQTMRQRTAAQRSSGDAHYSPPDLPLDSAFVPQDADPQPRRQGPTDGPKDSGSKQDEQTSVASWRSICPHKYKYVCVGFFAIAGPLFAIIWIAVRKDVSNGFGGGGFILTLGGIVALSFSGVHNRDCIEARHSRDRTEVRHRRDRIEARNLSYGEEEDWIALLNSSELHSRNVRGNAAPFTNRSQVNVAMVHTHRGYPFRVCQGRVDTASVRTHRGQVDAASIPEPPSQVDAASFPQFPSRFGAALQTGGW